MTGIHQVLDAQEIRDALERHGMTVAGQKRRGLRTYEGEDGVLLQADDGASIRKAARAHADFLESFPTDEDVEAAASYLVSFFESFCDDAPMWPSDEDALPVARAALLAVADARRTEEE